MVDRNFSDDMTRTAHALGMTELNFVNPNGLRLTARSLRRAISLSSRARCFTIFPSTNRPAHTGDQIRADA